MGNREEMLRRMFAMSLQKENDGKEFIYLAPYKTDLDLAMDRVLDFIREANVKHHAATDRMQVKIVDGAMISFRPFVASRIYGSRLRAAFVDDTHYKMLGAVDAAKSSLMKEEQYHYEYCDQV